MKLDWKSCLIACVSVFALYLAIHYWSSITSFAGVVASSASTLVIGAVIAYIVNILMSFYERKIAPKCTRKLWLKARRPLCMVMAFLTVVVALVLLVQLIVPQLVECFDKLAAALVKAVPELYNWLDERLNLSAFLQEQGTNFALPNTTDGWRTLLEKSASVLVSGLGGVMNAAVTVTTSLFGTIVTLFMSLIFACNILAGKEKLGSQSKRLLTRVLGEKLMGYVSHVVAVLDSCFHSYIVGQLIEALILGSLCALGMLLLQLDYALMIGALIGVMALIPIAGAYIGAALGAIMLFSVEPLQALIFLIWIVVLQQIEGNLIYPRTVGSTLHLPGIWVLAAVTIGGGVMGIMGMLLFVPLTAALYRLLGEWVSCRDKPSLVESIAAIDDDVPAIAVLPTEAGQAACVDAGQASAPAAAPAKAAPPAAPRRKQNSRSKRK